MKAVELYRELKRSGTGENKLEVIRNWMRLPGEGEGDRRDWPAGQLVRYLVELMGHPGREEDKNAGIRHIPPTPGFPLFCPGTVQKAQDIVARGKWDPTPQKPVDEFDLPESPKEEAPAIPKEEPKQPEPNQPAPAAPQPELDSRGRPRR